MKNFRPDGFGHIIITAGDNPPEDIQFDEIVCDACNADAGNDHEDGSPGRIYYDGSDSLCEACGAKAERRLLAEMVASVKQTAFVKGHQATDPEALGLLIARFFQWDGLSVLRAAQYALEDANFNAESAQVSAMADAIDAEKD
jgi:hypothetical protein